MTLSTWLVCGVKLSSSRILDLAVVLHTAFLNLNQQHCEYLRGLKLTIPQYGIWYGYGKYICIFVVLKFILWHWFPLLFQNRFTRNGGGRGLGSGESRPPNWFAAKFLHRPPEEEKKPPSSWTNINFDPTQPFHYQVTYNLNNQGNYYTMSQPERYVMASSLASDDLNVTGLFCLGVALFFWDPSKFVATRLISFTVIWLTLICN